jgi:hypothetical protein
MTEQEKQHVHAIAERVTKELADSGQIIEGGWRAYLILTGMASASDVQISECRKAYYAGAQHLFGSIMATLDSGTEPTEADLKRITLINEELDRWVQQFKKSN